MVKFDENKMKVGLSYFYFPNGKFDGQWDNTFVLHSIDDEKELLVFKFEKEFELPCIKTEMASDFYRPAYVQITFKDFYELVSRKCLRKEVEDEEEV